MKELNITIKYGWHKIGNMMDIEWLQVTLNQFEALFLQLNQNVATHCHCIYLFCISNCWKNSLMHKKCNFSDY